MTNRCIALAVLRAWRRALLSASLLRRLSATRPQVAALFYDPATHTFHRLGGLGRLCAGCGDLADYPSRRPGVLRDRRQTRHAATAHADPRPCRAVSECLAGGWTVPPRQRDLEGSLGRGCGRATWFSSAATAHHGMVGPDRTVPGQLFVHRRRTVRGVLDARAGLVRAAAMAAAGLCGRAHIRRRDGRVAHGRWRAFFQRCGICRRAHVFGDLDVHGLIYRWRPTRLTDEAAERPLERAAQASRGAGAADPGAKAKLVSPDRSNASAAAELLASSAKPAYSPRAFWAAVLAPRRIPTDA